MIKLPWKTIGSVVLTAAATTVTTIIGQMQQKKLIEDIGNKIGDEVLKNVNTTNINNVEVQ